jgi:zinc and cadmium transporter
MSEALWYALGAALVVSLVSFVGALTLSMRLPERSRWMLLLVSFAAGTMFAVVFFDLLPEAVEKAGAQAFPLVLGGIVVFFLVEKLLYWHHHHEWHHGHVAPKVGEHPHHAKRVHPVGYLNLVGDAVHNFLDGIVIAASFLASVPLGLVTTLAVIFHEIPQEMADFSVLVHAGFSRKRALLFNFGSALAAVLGVLVAFVFEAQVEGLESMLLPLAAGGFLYIAGSDLVPELAKESEPRESLLQLVPFGLGILILYGLSVAFAV